MLYSIIAVIWIITTSLTPIGTKYVSSHMDHLTSSFVSYISRALPFIVSYFILSSTNVIDPINLFSADNLMISSMEMIRSICSILAFSIVSQNSIIQAVYFTYPIFMLWFNHTMLDIPMQISSIISAICGIIGVSLITFVGNSANDFSAIYLIGIVLALFAACLQAYEVVFLKKEDIEKASSGTDRQQRMIEIVPQMAGFFTFGTILATAMYACYVMSNPLHGKFKIKGSFRTSTSTIMPVIGTLCATSFIPTLTHFLSLQGISPTTAALLPFSIVAVTVLVEWLFENYAIDRFKLIGIMMICVGGLIPVVAM